MRTWRMAHPRAMERTLTNLLLLRLRVLQDDGAYAIYRHVVLLQLQQHQLAEQHRRHHQRLYRIVDHETLSSLFLC